MQDSLKSTTSRACHRRVEWEAEYVPQYEVRVYDIRRSRRLVATVEIISPGIGLVD
jgi:hypothetical protein